MICSWENRKIRIEENSVETIDEIIKILDSAGRVNVHVHTHLCDGAADMTVENIASEAKKHRIGALDLITPTMNFNPLLPLRMVALTNPKTRDELHRSGEFEKAAAAAGGLPAEKNVVGLLKKTLSEFLNNPFSMDFFTGT